MIAQGTWLHPIARTQLGNLTETAAPAGSAAAFIDVWRVHAVAVACVSLLVTLRVSKKALSLSCSDTVLREVSSVFNLVKAAFLARTPACSVRIRRCGARSTLVS